MELDTQVKLINQMFKNEILFEQKEDNNSYNVQLCEDYDSMNLYFCKKKLDDKVNKNNYIKQLSKIDIRNSLFNSYFEIKKLKEINKNNWTEKLIYDKKNYNIQYFTLDNCSLLCYSDLNLDDDSFDYIWINNPFTKVEIDNENNLILKIAFEVVNQQQDDILNQFLSCLNKLELALISD